MWLSDTYLFLIYLIYLEISPLLVYIYYFFTHFNNNSYLWAEHCLNFAGVTVTFAEKSHTLAVYEPQGCIFLSTNVDDTTDLFAAAINVYLTHGRALNLSPYSFFSYCVDTIFVRKADVYTLLANSCYMNIVAYPVIKSETDNEPLNESLNEYNNRPSLYINLAWEKQMAIQIIRTHVKMEDNTCVILDLKNLKATYGSQIYCYRSEVVRPKYFNTLEEFACYVDNLLTTF
jgi:hypothetical protein